MFYLSEQSGSFCRIVSRLNPEQYTDNQRSARAIARVSRNTSVPQAGSIIVAVGACLPGLAPK
jgi:hypothetical protein